MKKYSYDTQDGLYDVAWSEVNENQLVVSSGDGSIKMWDTTLAVSVCYCSQIWRRFLMLKFSHLGLSYPKLA